MTELVHEQGAIYPLRWNNHLRCQGERAMRRPIIIMAVTGLGFLFGTTGWAAAQGQGGGTPYNCSSVVPADTPQAAERLSAIGAMATPDTLIGLGCSPETGIGTSGAHTGTVPFCGTGDSNGGVAVIGGKPGSCT
jgi:hypothetical protein